MRTIACRCLLVLLCGLFPGLLRAGANVPGEPDSLTLARFSAKLTHLRGIMIQPGQQAAAIAGADSLIAMAREAGSLTFMGRGLYVKGVAESASDQRAQGLQSLETAANFLEAAGDSTYLPKVYYSKGASAYQMERLEVAQLDAENAIAAARTVQDSMVLTLSINLIALIQKELGNYEVAIDYLKSGLDDVGERLHFYLLQNLGLVYKEMERYAEAKTCFEEVAAYYEEQQMGPELRIALNNVATVELRLKHPAAALRALEQLELPEQLGSASRVDGVIRLNLGVARQQLGRLRPAVEDFAAACAIFGRLGERKNLAIALANEAECRFLLGEYPLAYQLLDSAKVIDDSLQQVARAEAIADLEQKYRQETQKQRIEDLKKENAIILDRNKAFAESARNQRITLVLLVVILAILAVLGFVLFRLQSIRYQRRSEADKQLLLRQQIKPHFIFNAMNSIQHFLVHDRKKEGLLYLGKFGALLRLILNNSEQDLVPVSEELKLIRHYLEMEQIRTNHKFDFQIEAPPELEVEELYMPGMVLQVLVENAIWHGVVPLEIPGEIRVAVRKAAGKVEVVVEDNGVGLEKSRAGKVEERRSFGLDLVKKRIKRVHWNKVSYLFRLEEGRGSDGQVKGTQARIIFNGNTAG